MFLLVFASVIMDGLLQYEKGLKMKLDTDFANRCSISEHLCKYNYEFQPEEERMYNLVDQTSSIFLEAVETNNLLHRFYRPTLRALLNEFVIYENREQYIKFDIQFKAAEEVPFIVMDPMERTATIYKDELELTEGQISMSVNNFKINKGLLSQKYAHIDFSEPTYVNELILMVMSEKKAHIEYMQDEQTIFTDPLTPKERLLRVYAPRQKITRINISPSVRIESIELSILKPAQTDEDHANRIVAELIKVYSRLHVNKNDISDHDTKSKQILKDFFKQLSSEIQDRELSSQEILQIIANMQMNYDSDYLKVIQPVIRIFQEQHFTANDINDMIQALDSV